MTEQDQPQGYDNSGSSRDSRTDEIRRKAIDAYDGARDSIEDAGRRASDAIDEAPLIALAGGLAAGALIAALLPKTRTEEKMLGPVSEKISSRAREAAQAAKSAGTNRLKELGLTPDAGAESLKSVLKSAGDAAKVSAEAAVGTVKGDRS